MIGSILAAGIRIATVPVKIANATADLVIDILFSLPPRAEEIDKKGTP